MTAVRRNTSYDILPELSCLAFATGPGYHDELISNKLTQ